MSCLLACLTYDCVVCRDGGDLATIDVSTGALKPLIPAFAYAGYEHVSNNPGMVVTAWRKATLLRMFDPTFQRTAVKLQDEGVLFFDNGVPLEDEDPSGAVAVEEGGPEGGPPVDGKSK